MKKNFFLVTAVLIGSVAGAQRDTTALSEVVVTANRFAQKQNSSGKVVTVITAQQLARSSGRTLADLLNQQAGLTIVGAQNNLGTNQDLYLRGAATGKTLILVDGIPAYDPSTISTAFDLNQFSIDNIERIEIVRGAMSTLYGSDAVAGVINIITKKSGTRPLGGFANLAAGSFGTFKGVAGINGHKGNTQYNAHYTHLQANGFSAAYDSAGKQAFDKDGFNQDLVSVNVSTQLTSKLLARISGRSGYYRNDLDAAAYTDEKDYTFSSRNYQGTAGLEYKWTGGKVVANYNFNTLTRRYEDDSAYVGGFAKYTSQRYTGNAHLAEVYANFSISRHIGLLAGADYRFQNTDQHYFSLSSFGPYETKQGKDSLNMNQYSVFASAFLQQLGGFHLEVGGRYNRHSEYGSNATYTINPSLLLGSRVKLFANAAAAFKAPSLYQLFVIGAAPGQPLKAEQSHTFEAGVEYQHKELFARAVFFNRNIKNGIEYNLVNDTYFNNNRQQDHGLELEGRARAGIFDFNVNYTYVTGKVNTTNFVYNAATWSYTAKGDTTYYNLFRGPKHTVNINVGATPVKDLYLSLHARLAGKRLEPVYMSQPVAMDPYQTFDLYAEYRICKGLKAFADLKNLTNKRFFDVLGYNARRFQAIGGLTLNL